MKFAVLINLTDEASPNILKRLAADEAKMVWDSHKRGVLEIMFHRADRPGVMAIMQAASETEIRQELQQLPLYQYMSVQIIPLKPYDGYEALWLG